MLTFNIQHEEEYSRGQLLLRTFLGWLYICIPHFFAMFVFAFLLSIMTFVTFFIILISGTTPQWYFEWTVQLNKWGLRLIARLFNLCDGYPAFGMEGKDDKTRFEMERWQISRGELLLRTFLGFIYVGIPHGLILYFRQIGTVILAFLAFFTVLFTGKYPKEWHQFNVGTFRWSTRVNLYLCWLYRDYPPFSGKPDEQHPFDFENQH
jgi:hypothetical protein